MNQINFLPPSFYRQRFRRRRIAVEVLLVVGVAVALGAWFFLGDQSLYRLRSEADKVADERTQVQSQIKELSQIQAQFHELSAQMKIHQFAAMSSADASSATSGRRCRTISRTASRFVLTIVSSRRPADFFPT